MFEKFENAGREAVSVSEFCTAIGMAKRTFEGLDDKPRTFRVGTGRTAKRLIPIPDARAWVEAGYDG